MSWRALSQDSLLKVNEILEQLKNHDYKTFNHCVRVSHLCRFLADAAQLAEDEVLLAQMSGLLHDVGKVKIPLSILNKPGKLTDEEYSIMKKHSLFSAEMLESLEKDPFFREVQLAVLHHHERVDGKGYPLQLQNEEIPYTSRLILIADTVDAMGQTRAYRRGLPIEVIYQELEKFAGSQFDAELVSVFIAAHKKAQNEDRDNVVKLPWLEMVA